MISMYDFHFSLFILCDVLGLFLCSFILKKFVKYYPNKLIPLANVILSIVTTIVYFNHQSYDIPFHTIIIIGIVDGLATVGLHQLIKQTSIYIALRRYFKERQQW